MKQLVIFNLEVIVKKALNYFSIKFIWSQVPQRAVKGFLVIFDEIVKYS